MTKYDSLDAELRALGEPWRDETADDEVIAGTMARVSAAPIPRRRRIDAWLARLAAWRRWAVAGIAGLVVVVVLVPPIRAEVGDWFGFGGVIVRESPETTPPSAPDPPTLEGEFSLAQARNRVEFDVFVPRALGAPDAVDVTGGRRIVSMVWNTPDGAIRLDEFDGTLQPVFVKKIYSDAVVAEIEGEMALWLDEPHEVVVLDGDGSAYEAPARRAGSTLIWQRGSTTLRLEGEIGRSRALEIARSARQ